MGSSSRKCACTEARHPAVIPTGVASPLAVCTSTMIGSLGMAYLGLPGRSGSHLIATSTVLSKIVSGGVALSGVGNKKKKVRSQTPNPPHSG